MFMIKLKTLFRLDKKGLGNEDSYNLFVLKCRDIKNNALNNWSNADGKDIKNNVFDNWSNKDELITKSI